jgi:predicted transcriptional regulator of viral defense system
MKYELGSLESELIFTLEQKNKYYFTVKDANQILDTSEEVIWKTLHKLTEKKRIQRIKKGHYLLIPARAGYETKWREEVTRFIDQLLDEYYIGYWTALNLWHLTEQIPHTVFIATIRRKRALTYDKTVPIQFITLNPEKFFGYTTMKTNNTQFKISDPEKTIIDSLDLPQYSGGITEIAKALQNDLNPDTLIKYADRLGNKTVHKRLGYLIQVLNLNYPEETITQLRNKISKGYSWLDPTQPKQTHNYNTEWNLKVNIPLDALKNTTQ